MDRLKFYIDGAWVDPAAPSTLGVVNPATEETFAMISLGSAADVDRAARAARRAFATYSETTIEQRLGWLRGIIEDYVGRFPTQFLRNALDRGGGKRCDANARSSGAGEGH